MMNYYRLRTPTPERCIEKGVKYDGLNQRILNWVLGVSFGLKSVDSNISFNVLRNDRRDIIVQTDSVLLMDSVANYLADYGFTCEQIPENVS